MNNGKQNKRIAVIVGSIAAVVVIAGIIASTVILNQPKVRLARAVSKIQKELSEYGSPATKQINHSLLQENMESTPHTVKADTTVTFPNSDKLKNLNLSLQMGKDNSSRLADIDLTAGAYQVKLVNGKITVEDNKLYISVPKLSENTYSLQLDTLGADYNASAWSDILKLDIEPDASYDFFVKEDVDYTNVSELAEALSPAAQTLKEAILIEKAPDKVSVKTQNKSMTCSGVSITIPSGVMNTFLSDFQEKFMASSMYQQKLAKLIEQYSISYLFEDDIRELINGKVDDKLGIRCMNDVSLNLYMDSKGRIVRIATPQAIEFKDSDIKSMELSADFMGSERALDVISAQYKLDTVNGVKAYTISREASITEEEYQEDLTLDVVGVDNTTELTMNYNNTWKLSSLAFDGAWKLQFPENTYRLSADGSYQDIVEGESYTLDLDTASFEMNDEALLRVAGTFSVEPGMEDVEIPQTSTDLMQMDSLSIYGLFYKLLTAVE